MVCMIIVINRNFTKIVKREVKSNVLHCLLDLVFARPFDKQTRPHPFKYFKTR